MEFFTKLSNKSRYSRPGLYSVYCVITENGIFGESENMYDSLFTIYCQLLEGVFENRTVQNDFQVYGAECFRFDPVAWGEEFNDPIFRQKKLQELNNS
jgi:hypothetical protein